MRADWNTVLLCFVILAHGYAGRIPPSHGVAWVGTAVNVAALVLVVFLLIHSR
jgi:hypothetical protein